LPVGLDRLVRQPGRHLALELFQQSGPDQGRATSPIAERHPAVTDILGGQVIGSFLDLPVVDAADHRRQPTRAFGNRVAPNATPVLPDLPTAR